MPLAESATPSLSVDDVLAFDDAELVEYMKQTVRDDGGFDLEFEGWENLPNDQRDRLAERLRIGARKVNDMVQSRPVDPDQLTARLYGVIANDEAAPQALSKRSRREKTPTEEVDLDAEGKRSETIAYNALVGDGGRPVYPIDRLEDVFHGFGSDDELLQPWQDRPGDCRQVFQEQLHRWEMFRRWQHANREPDKEREFAAYVREQRSRDAEGTAYRPTASQYLEQLRDAFEREYSDLDGGDEGFGAYVEKKKQQKLQAGCRWPGMTKDEYSQMLRNQFKTQQAKAGIDEDEGFAEFVDKKKRKDTEAGRRWPGMTEDEYIRMLRVKFHQEQDRHYWKEFYWLREDHGHGGFSGYISEAKRRLGRHGLTKEFEMDRDSTRQDELTTWFEYLNYEYSWLDHHTQYLTRLQAKYDKGWQKLVDSGVLRRGETAAELCSMESAIRSQSERDAAKKAVDHAKTAAVAALQTAMNDPNSKSRLRKPVRIRMMKQANFRLEAAKASFKDVMRRGDLITDFVQEASDYRATERNLILQRFRLQWVKEQIPLIEAEVREAPTAEERLSTRWRTKRRSDDDQDIQTRGLKRKKPSPQTGTLDDGAPTRARASKRSRPTNAQGTQLQKKQLANASSIGDSRPRVNPAGRRAVGSRHHQLRSATVQLEAPLLRRSPRFAAAQAISSKPGTLPPRVTRSGLRPRPKT
ncbi:hypothetical protein AAL_02210 [Moelleriella libera RCEF 2490]|uniref:Ankyrin 2,3/unc44 n=1 Tax=Moelleriella libera RCEF 2490 TaxID=1081109 RepID=A0A168F9V1_9HYPO|nr:hypothetical protein AAL_02210 [Moelleriella libera RCEF 2490]